MIPIVVNQLHDTEPRWFAVNTRSKSEKLVQRMLQKKDVHAYVPIQKLMRRYTRSVRMIEKPLINCYVFVKILKPQYVPVLETENVVGFVRFAKNLIAIPEHEIDILRRITLEDELEIEAVQGNYTTGDAVEISAGNLIGLKGHVVKIEGKKKMQVELKQLGFSLIISIDTAFLSKIRE